MPQTVGRYEIERELGEGGMATVYLARDTVMDRKVVVKVILRDYTRDPQFRARFMREAKTSAALEHDSIVSVHDFGEHDGQPYIVMRQMSGGSLQDRAPYSQLTLPEIARIIERIADALDYVHSKGVIHRDLKPANILFDERGKAYLSDFGIAKLSEASTQLTGTGIIGTPAYMSPEQAQAMQDLDKRSDVYSLGVIVFQLLTGELPYHARDAMGMALAHISQPVPEIRKIRPELPRETDSLIKRAMAKKPGDRYQTTTDLANDLSKLANKPATKPRGNLFQPSTDKPKTPTPATLKPALPADDPPPTSSPESVSVSPKANRPAVWTLLTALVAVCILAALLAGILAVPNLLTRSTATAQPTNVAVNIVTPPTLTRTQPVSTPVSLIQSSSTATVRPSLTPTTQATITPSPQSTIPAPTLGIGSTQVSAKDGMLQLFVPAGEFTMGSEGASGPAHKVKLDAFWIDKTEVTNAMFLIFLNEVAATLTNSDDHLIREGNVIYDLCSDCDKFSRIKTDGSSFSVVQKYANHPVTTVTWYGASAYCQWAGRRLPTEAEWEKAARGTDERVFPWGNNVADMSLTNYQGRVGDTTEVGHYPNGASPYWALDMAGNVWEWVNDWYAKDYYENSPLENPVGSTSGDSKILRGGSWLNVPNGLRSDNRAWNSLTYNDSIVGFRCASSP